jgi:hypothetical protein
VPHIPGFSSKHLPDEGGHNCSHEHPKAVVVQPDSGFPTLVCCWCVACLQSDPNMQKLMTTMADPEYKAKVNIRVATGYMYFCRLLYIQHACILLVCSSTPHLQCACMPVSLGSAREWAHTYKFITTHWHLSAGQHGPEFWCISLILA